MISRSDVKSSLEERLSQEYLGIVVSQATKFPTNSVCDVEDYIQVGLQTLVLAVRSFKKSKNTKWTTYLTTCVRRAIKNESDKFKYQVTTFRKSSKIFYRTQQLLKENRSPEEIKNILHIDDNTYYSVSTILGAAKLYANNIAKMDSENIIEEYARGLLNEEELKVMTLFLDGYNKTKIAETIGKNRKWVDERIKKSKEKLRKSYSNV